MDPIYLPLPLPPLAQRAAEAAFPSYRGAKFAFEYAATVEPYSYWDGGARTYWVFLELPSFRTSHVPTHNPNFQGALPSVQLAAGYVAVSRTQVGSRDQGITFHAPEPSLLGIVPSTAPAALAKLLGPDVGVVLAYTAGLKTGRFQNAARAEGITLERWERAKTQCIEAGWLTANGALTPVGRNAVGSSRPGRL